MFCEQSGMETGRSGRGRLRKGCEDGVSAASLLRQRLAQKEEPPFHLRLRRPRTRFIRVRYVQFPALKEKARSVSPRTMSSTVGSGQPAFRKFATNTR